LTGSNIEPRLTHLRKAKSEIRNRLGELKMTSSIYESEPWGFETDDAFLNQVVAVDSAEPSEEVLKIILGIESEMGRTRRGNGYSSRIIDIDILYFGDDNVKQENLVLPHPRMHLRRFTLEPLVEIAPGFVHPILKKTNRELLNECNDVVKVWRYNN
jgi:2-amino-4-hydroxy-6-hydroxymethyldihydropteridine diphosphokinase